MGGADLDSFATTKILDNQNESVAPERDDIKLLDDQKDHKDQNTAKAADKKKIKLTEEDLKKFRIPKTVMDELQGKVVLDDEP